MVSNGDTGESSDNQADSSTNCLATLSWHGYEQDCRIVPVGLYVHFELLEVITVEPLGHFVENGSPQPAIPLVVDLIAERPQNQVKSRHQPHFVEETERIELV